MQGEKQGTVPVYSLNGFNCTQQPLTPAQLKGINDRIRQILAALSQAPSLVSLNFPPLAHYFSRRILELTRVVFVEKCPLPPLSDLGPNQFADFEKEERRGITYRGTYFLLHQKSLEKALHFHELVHVV